MSAASQVALRPGGFGGRRRSPLIGSWRRGYLLAGPALIVMIAIFLYPLGYSFVMSFFRWDLSAGSDDFLGLANYIDSFNSPDFLQSLRNQMIFSAVSLSVELVGGMAIALLINGKLRGLRLARTLLLIPPMIAPAVVGLNFRWLFNEQYGLIDALLRDLHLPPIPWLSDPNWALVSVIIADVWQNTPLMVLLFLAGSAVLAAGTAGGGRGGWSVCLAHILLGHSAATAAGDRDRADAADHRYVPDFRYRLADDAGRARAAPQTLITVQAYLLAFQSVDFGHAAAVSYIALVASLLFLAVLYGAPRLWAKWRPDVSDQALAHPQVAGGVQETPSADLARLSSRVTWCCWERSSSRFSACLAVPHLPANSSDIFAVAGAHLSRSSVTASQYIHVFSQYGLASYLWNTVIVSLVTVVTVTVLALPCAYAMARLRLPGRNVIVGCC